MTNLLVNKKALILLIKFLKVIKIGTKKETREKIRNKLRIKKQLYIKRPAKINIKKKPKSCKL